mmetsp:Transcript_10033/g.24105  ORF Transcript_10033/g.24105 Transcript_10033/m.24105 type:complete len:132 (+) Transcript_10033:630-1025(+)
MCMHPGCSATLPDSQVKKLTPSIYQRYIQNKFMDYEKRVLDLFLFDDDFAAWARANTQSCPRCHVLVQRSDGCVLQTHLCCHRQAITPDAFDYHCLALREGIPTKPISCWRTIRSSPTLTEFVSPCHRLQV